jgi:hypothetical protein
VTQIFSRVFSPKVIKASLQDMQVRYYNKHFAQPSIGPLLHVGVVVSATGYYFHDKHFRTFCFFWCCRRSRLFVC